MPKTTFLRLLAHDDKPAALAATIAALRAGEPHPDVFAVDPASFKAVPGSPMAYWVSEELRRIFVLLPPFEAERREVKQGLATADDFRFVRTSWEVRYSDLGPSSWVPFAKGGAFSPYYSDLHLTVNWRDNGRELRQFERAFIRNERLYFSAGLTWALRTQRGFNMRIYPSDAIFGHKGPVAFVETALLPSCLGLCNSLAFMLLLSLQMAFGSYEVGVIQRTPIPDLDNPQGARLGELALACVELKRDLDRANETSHVFHLPALLQVAGETLAERAAAWAVRVAAAETQLAANQGEIDAIAFALYGIDRAATEDEGGNHRGTEAQSSEEDEGEGEGEGEGEVCDQKIDPTSVPLRLCGDLISYLTGCAFGRFDIRHATGALPTPALPDPFAPLPACAPGMLMGADGLPLRAAPTGYPLRLTTNGILVDDPDHPDDIVGRIHAALDVACGARAEASEHELCAALNVADLREYMRRPGVGGFWANHLKRYAKSRRKAPIYWLLQSPKRTYALWLYLHRLDGDTLSKALVSYVEPKLRLEEERLARLLTAKDGLTGRDLRQAERDSERQEASIADIRELRARLDRAVRHDLTPDLNDGVVLTIAPLYELVPWKEATFYWDELLAGKYEWSSIGKQLRAKGMVK